MKILVKEKLSEHKYKTPEGYLICQDAVLARTGDQGYLKSELYEDFEGDDTLIQVQRKPEQVFAAEALSSFEDKPITIEHPDENVGPDNYSDLAVGHTRNVRKGTFNGQEVMIADLVITDTQAIEEIENGIRNELSCGYDCDITDGDHPEQINIRGNHIALCKEGRAGIAKIIDSKPEDESIAQKVRENQDLDEMLKNSILVSVRAKFGDLSEKDIIRKYENRSYDDLNEHLDYILGGEKPDVLKRILGEDVKVEDSSNPLPSDKRKEISKYLASISKFTGKDIDITDIIEPIKSMGYNVVREKINGWNKMDDGVLRKDYFFTVDDYDDVFMVSLYANPDTFEVTEINAYFVGKKKDMNDIKIEDVSKGPWTVMYAWADEDGEPYTETAVAFAETEDDAKEIVKSYHPQASILRVVKGALANSFDYPYYYHKKIDIDDAKDVKIEDKFVVFMDDDGCFCSTSKASYDRFGRDLPKSKYNKHRWARNEQEVVDYLINNAGLTRDQIITIGDPSGKVETKDDGYRKAFYKNGIKALKKRIKELEKDNDDSVKDENDEEYERQKFNVYKLIKEQIDEYEADEEEAPEETITDASSKRYPFSMRRYGHNIEYTYNYLKNLTHDMEEGKEEWDDTAFESLETLSEVYANAMSLPIYWATGKEYEVLKKASSWAESMRDQVNAEENDD